MPVDEDPAAQDDSAAAAQPEGAAGARSDSAAAEPATDAALRGAVVVAAVPNQPDRVLRVAADYARLHAAPLVVVHVDVARFVTYEDPDGYVHSAPIDLNLGAGENELTLVREKAAAVLDPLGLSWSLRQLVGDPALAIKTLAESLHASLIVVGTRNRGLGESIREFFTGSVAARLAHRQHRPILVVPLDQSVPDDQDLWVD